MEGWISKLKELQANTDELISDFGYSFSRNKLNLSQYRGELDRLKQLQEHIEEILPNVILSTERSRREILIAPVVTDLVHYTNAQLRIEYSLKVTEQLQGYLDYFLYSHHNVIVIEAKKGDLDYGFNQLAVQLIALDKWEKTKEENILLGAVTSGNLWQFGRLTRDKKHLEQGLESYRVPEDIEPLMRILVQALS